MIIEIMLLLLCMFLFVASIAYWVIFYIEGYWEEIETRKELLKAIFIPFYCWFQMLIEYYKGLK